MAAAEPGEVSEAQRLAAQRRAELKRRVAELARQDDEEHRVEPARTTHERRVYFVLDLMIDGSFVTGRTSRDLSKMWSLSLSYVQGVCGEASRLYKTFYLSDPEELELLALRVRQGFERLAASAEAMAAEHGPYALKVAGEQYANMALYAGIKPADKHEHTGKDGAPLEPGVVLLPRKDEATDDDGDGDDASGS